MYSTGKEASVSKLIVSLKYGGITLKGQFTDRFFFSRNFTFPPYFLVLCCSTNGQSVIYDFAYGQVHLNFCSDHSLELPLEITTSALA